MAKGKRGRRRKRDKFEEIRDLRIRNYRQTPELIIKNQEDAIEFVKEVGICLLFPSDKIELPNLLQSVYGMPHPMINDTHWDKETMWTWSLKDNIPETKQAFYGKFVQDKGTFLSPDFITYFYSIFNLSPNTDNFQSLYQTGEINQYAKNIAELILKEGSLSARALRKKLNMTSRKGGVAFQQAITNLQSKLIVTNFGTDKEGGSIPSTKYELVTRVFYDEVERSQQITPDEARKIVINRYFDTAVGTNEKEVSQLLGWNVKIVESIFKELKEIGKITILDANNESHYYDTKYNSLAS